MLRRSEAELISYVADNSDRVSLALMESPDPAAAVTALERAAAAVLQIPHPVEPGDPLPNWCQVLVEDGRPVLHVDMQDHREYAGRVVTTILASLDAAGVDGRLEPKRPLGPR
jgi:hypothetical protein